MQHNVIPPEIISHYSVKEAGPAQGLSWHNFEFLNLDSVVCTTFCEPLTATSTKTLVLKGYSEILRACQTAGLSERFRSGP